MSNSGVLSVLVRAVARRLASSGRAAAGLIAFIITASVACNPPEILWTARFPGDGSSSGYAVRPTRDGGFVAVGVTGVDSIRSGMYIVKVDSGGGLQWNTTLGGATSRDARDVLQLSDGGLAVLGSVTHDTIALVRMDSVGAVLWERFYGIGFPAEASAMVQTSDQGFAIAAHDLGSGVVIRVDSAGAVVWRCVIDSAVYGFERAQVSIAAARDGGFAVGMMRTWPPHCPRLVKLSASGNVEWDSSYAYTRGAAIFSVAATADGGYAVTGVARTLPGEPRSGEVFLAKMGATGELSWMKYFVASGNSHGTCVRQTRDGGYVVAGCDMCPEHSGGGQAGVWRTSDAGVPLWNITYGLGGKAPDIARRIECLPDGGYIVCGNVAHGEPDAGWWSNAMFVMRLGADPIDR